LGENGDGTASQSVQIHSLQADLADKNRYISTLEKRLLHARRSSHSRVSMGLSHKIGGSSEDGGLIATIAEKDSEISNLRAQLEDKERMIAALTSARKKSETAHEVGSDGSPGSRRTSSINRTEISSSMSLMAKGPTSPISTKPFLPPTGASNTGKNIEEMTRMLDEMIGTRVDSARVDKAARRTSLMPVSEGR
jgi:centromeric protein E